MSASETVERRSRRRRSAPRPPVRVGAISLGLAAVLVVSGAGAAIVGLGTATPTIGASAAEPVTTVVPVASTELICPEPGAAEGARTLVSVAALAGLPGQEGEGSVEVHPVPDPQDVLGAITGPGRTTAVAIAGEGSPPFAIAARGSTAPGVVAAQTGRAVDGQGRGLASAACLAAGSSWWFLGGGAALGQLTRIVLVNPEASPALVDVTVHGPDGPVELPATRGIALTSRSQTVLRLDRLIPGVAAGAIHVTASSGRVAVGVSDARTDGLIGQGVDWVQPAAEPSRRAIVPGISEGGGARELRLIAPVATATASIRVHTAAGSFVPVGLGAVEVPVGRLVSVDLTRALEGQAATVEVTSDEPIVAGVRQDFGAATVAGEVSYVAAVAPTAGPTAAAGLPGALALGGTGFIRVWVTAPDAAASVRVRVLPATGGQTMRAAVDTTLDIPARRVAALDIEPPADVRWFTVLVEPTAGSVVAAHRVIERGPGGSLVTGYAWAPLRVSVTLTTAIPEVAAGVPGR